jgi:hypothetical protein
VHCFLWGYIFKWITSYFRNASESLIDPYVKGKAVSVLSVKHYAMKAYGGVEV